MSLNIFPLSEGLFTIGHDKVFIPFESETDILTDRSIGSLLVEIQPFLVQVNGKNILLDTGLGFVQKDGELQIHSNLRKLGISKNDIDMVLLSHLHKDHTGGIFHENELGIQEVNFPNATYHISKQEFNYALEKGAPSYHIEDFESLKNSNSVEWLGESGTIHECIEYKTIGGHCPYHVSFAIKADGEVLFFGGDVVPQLRQLKTRYIAKYDFDGRKCMELRQEFLQKGTENHWTFLFYHDVNQPFVRF